MGDGVHMPADVDCKCGLSGILHRCFNPIRVKPPCKKSRSIGGRQPPPVLGGSRALSVVVGGDAAALRRQSVQCYQCAQFGHYAAECWEYTAPNELPRVDEQSVVKTVQRRVPVKALTRQRQEEPSPEQYSRQAAMGLPSSQRAEQHSAAVMQREYQRLRQSVVGNRPPPPDNMRVPYSDVHILAIPVEVAGRTTSAQIDTGSPISIVGRDPILRLIERCGRQVVSEHILPSALSYFGYTGPRIPFSGVISLWITVNRNAVLIPFHIDMAARRELLLGMSFLTATGCQLNLMGPRVSWQCTPRSAMGDSFVDVYYNSDNMSQGMRTAEGVVKRREREPLTPLQEDVLVQPPNNSHHLREESGMLAPTISRGAPGVVAPPPSQEYLPRPLSANSQETEYLQPRTRQFIKMVIPDLSTTKGEISVLVSELVEGAFSELRIPDQLVKVRREGLAWIEVQNESEEAHICQPETIRACVDVDFTLHPESEEDWVKDCKGTGVPELFGLTTVDIGASPDTATTSAATIVKSVEPQSVGAVEWNLENLKFTSIEERFKSILGMANIAADNPDITVSQREALVNLLLRNHDVLATSDDELGSCKLEGFHHQIDTGDTPPIALPVRRVPMAKQEGVRAKIQNMRDNGVIRPSSSPWSSPIVPVWKSDGKVRITVDYRKLNEVTKKDKYPLARCDELIDSMGLERPEFFTSLDLVQGYHQQRIAPEAIEKTAFSCPGGHFEYNRLPMGLCNSPASFQRLQNEILKHNDPNKVKVYLDDVAIATKTFEDHLQQLELVLSRFREAGMRVKLTKCQFLRKELIYLGYKISKNGMQTNPAKVEDIKRVPRPKSVRDVRKFCGLCSFYRRFVPNFSAIARPLTRLTSKDQPWVWGEEQESAFVRLKEILTSDILLAFPQWGKPYYILCDASAQGLGAILHQKTDQGVLQPIAYASRATDKNEQKYGASELECLCLVWALQYFHYYIWGQEVIVECDHQPLTCLNSKLTLPPRLERWNAIIQPYNVTVVYRKGRENEPADALSRLGQDKGTSDGPAVDESAIVGRISNFPDPDVDAVRVEREMREKQRKMQLEDPFFAKIIEQLERVDQQPSGDPKQATLAKLAALYLLDEGVL